MDSLKIKLIQTTLKFQKVLCLRMKIENAKLSHVQVCPPKTQIDTAYTLIGW